MLTELVWDVIFNTKKDNIGLENGLKGVIYVKTLIENKGENKYRSWHRAVA